MEEMLGININSNFTIPKYLLLNGKGEFVKELYSRVTREKLANQIKELLGKNRNLERNLLILLNQSLLPTNAIANAGLRGR
jgi:hypothetical protein